MKRVPWLAFNTWLATSMALPVLLEPYRTLSAAEKLNACVTTGLYIMPLADA